MEMFLVNRVLVADEALGWGIVNQVVADEDVLATANGLAARLAAGPRGAYGVTKRLLGDSEPGLESQLARESVAISRQGQSDEAREGIAAFLAKRAPKYS